MATDIDLSEFVDAEFRKGPACWRESLPLTDEQEAKITAALDEPTITSVAIAKVLRAWGYELTGTTVARHRRGACGCGR
jgi:hypothetical protein